MQTFTHNLELHVDHTGASCSGVRLLELTSWLADCEHCLAKCALLPPCSHVCCVMQGAVGLMDIKIMKLSGFQGCPC